MPTPDFFTLPAAGFASFDLAWVPRERDAAADRMAAMAVAPGA